MPDWCENQLVIKGQKEKVQEFVDKAKRIDFCGEDELKEEPRSLLMFSSFYPIPKELFAEDGDSDTWHIWTLKNWGCKWDPDKTELKITTLDNITVATYRFLTAWSPPDVFVRKVSKDMPDLDFLLIYSEFGTGFYGILNVIQGKVIIDMSMVSEMKRNIIIRNED